MSEPKHTTALPYYGWFVLAAAAVSEMLVQGATSYGAGLFVLPLQSEFGLSRADASSSVIILFIGTLFLSPAAGRILDRAPIRLAVGAGTICFSLALAVIAWSSSLWIMVLARHGENTPLVLDSAKFGWNFMNQSQLLGS